MFLDLLHWYFKGKLEELSAIMAGELNEDYKSQCKDDMDLDGKGKISSKSGQRDFDESYQLEKFSNIDKLVKNIGKVVLDLRSLGFTSMAEDAYASAIFSLLKVNVPPHGILFFSLYDLYYFFILLYMAPILQESSPYENLYWVSF